jgi:acetyl esterase/lipase
MIPFLRLRGVRVRFLAAALAVVLVSGACAASIPVEPLEPEEIEVRQRFSDFRNEVLPQLVTFYGQAADTDPVPIVILAHGLGGNREGMEVLAQPLSEKGLIVINVAWFADTSHLLESMADVPCAVAYAYENAASWNGDPERIIVIGHSAGVNAAMMAALSPDKMVQCENRTSSKVWAVIGVAGDPSNVTEGGILWNMLQDTRRPSSYSSTQAAEVLETINPYNHFGNNPNLIARFVHSDGDVVVDPDRDEQFAMDMAAAGYDVEFILMEGGGHGSVWPEEVLQIVDELISRP